MFEENHFSNKEGIFFIKINELFINLIDKFMCLGIIKVVRFCFVMSHSRRGPSKRCEI
jgi:hypothetical protein